MTTRTTPDNIRKRAVDAVEGGMSYRAAARLCGVSHASVVAWVARKRKTGSFEAKPRGGDRRSKPIEQFADAIIAKVAEEPGITLHSLADWIGEVHGLKVSHVAVWNFLNRHGVGGREKRPSRR